VIGCLSKTNRKVIYTCIILHTNIAIFM
jgi:hypothetical protein